MKLVGRDEEAAQLASLIGAHRVVLVCGPAGIGKTALVRAVVEKLGRKVAVFDGVALPADLPPDAKAVVIARERRELAGVPVLELGPLPREALLQLCEQLEAERGRSLRHEFAERSAGNPMALRALLGMAQRPIAPDDPQALLAAARAATPRESLELLRSHALLRRALDPRQLEQLLREAAGDPQCAAEALLLLAREQLHWGEFDDARATAEAALRLDVSAAEARRAHVLRAEALVRAGDPQAAAQALQAARAPGDPAVALGLLELSVLRGELGPARRGLLHLQTTHPALEGRRATILALSYLFEERYRLALAWTRRARRAFARRKGAAADPLTAVVEVAALLNLDRIDAAVQAASREAAREGRSRSLGSGPLALFQAGVLMRRGQLREALELSEPSFRALDRRADRIFRAIVAHYSCRLALALGQLARAEQDLRAASGIAESPGLGVLRPLCELDFALLSEARGRREEARERALRAVEALPRSPAARAEAWALGAPVPRPRVAEPSVAAFVALRAAERALEEGQLREAAEEATRAARWYERASARWELSRAQLVLAEVAAREGGDSGGVLESSPYPPVRVAALLVRAAICDREGQFERARAALETALQVAGDELRDPSLLRACARVGIAPLPPPAAAEPFAARVRRLGLDRPVELLAESGERRWLLAADDPLPAGFDLLVRADRGQAQGARVSIALPPQGLQLLEALVRAGEAGASVEELHRKVWRAKTFHPLRHRNSVYVALTRLRDLLRGVLEGETLVETDGGRYRVAPHLRSAVVYAAASAAPTQENRRRNAVRRQTK